MRQGVLFALFQQLQKPKSLTENLDFAPASGRFKPDHVSKSEPGPNPIDNSEQHSKLFRLIRD